MSAFTCKKTQVPQPVLFILADPYELSSSRSRPSQELSDAGAKAGLLSNQLSGLFSQKECLLGCRSPQLIEPLEGICYLNLPSPRYISKPQMSEEIGTRRRRNPLAVVVLCKCVSGLPASAISTSCVLTCNFEGSLPSNESETE